MKISPAHIQMESHVLITDTRGYHKREVDAYYGDQLPSNEMLGQLLSSCSTPYFEIKYSADCAIRTEFEISDINPIVELRILYVDRVSMDVAPPDDFKLNITLNHVDIDLQCDNAVLRHIVISANNACIYSFDAQRANRPPEKTLARPPLMISPRKFDNIKVYEALPSIVGWNGEVGNSPAWARREYYHGTDIGTNRIHKIYNCAWKTGSAILIELCTQRVQYVEIGSKFLFLRGGARNIITTARIDVHRPLSGHPRAIRPRVYNMYGFTYYRRIIES